jgi:hypothetical protein
MNFNEIKAAAAALSPEDQIRLVRHLQSLEVMRDPEWQEIVHEAAEHREKAAQARAEQHSSAA